MKAAIDIGTNTVLLLIGETDQGKVIVHHEEQRMPRLGKGVDADKTLHSESIARVIAVLKEYKQIIESEYPLVDDVTVTATSAVRDASNRDAFIEQVKQETGYNIILVSGDNEARYTFQGAISVIDIETNQDVFVLDIGGGSTELALGRKGDLLEGHSYDMGCVRFSERFLTQDPPFQEQIQECREAIRELLESKKFKTKKGVKAVGVAGTLTSLAAIDLQVEDYDAEKINMHVIKREKLKKGIELFSLHTHEQLLEISPTILKGREDIFLAGLLILEEFLNFYNLDEIMVSTGGIRHGVLSSLFATAD
jgi:exopolyphosphatase/guanosine-5'-triphosphate,3'-diphosphate pyrophosphatase